MVSLVKECPEPALQNRLVAHRLVVTIVGTGGVGVGSDSTHPHGGFDLHTQMRQRLVKEKQTSEVVVVVES
jgi:hypothetical protein